MHVRWNNILAELWRLTTSSISHSLHKNNYKFRHQYNSDTAFFSTSIQSYWYTFLFLINYLVTVCLFTLNFYSILYCNEQKCLRRPGIEPGSIAWKATMLTTIPPTLPCIHLIRSKLNQSVSISEANEY